MRYRKRALQTALNVVLLLGAVCTGASGQRSPSVTASAPAKVYVAEFAPSEDSKASSLNSFARQFFKLKVLGVSSVDLAGDSEVAPCGSSSYSSGESSTRIPLQTTERVPVPPSVPPYYTVQGTIDVHEIEEGVGQQDESNILLAYELVKTKNCQATIVFQQKRSFRLVDALQNLQEASEDLSAQLDDDIAAKATVKVGAIEAVGDPDRKFRAADLLTRFTQQRIADAADLRLWNEGSRGDPKYTLTGRVQFSRVGEMVTPHLQFFADGKPLRADVPPRTVSATADGLIPFFLDASSAAAKSLSDLFYAQRAGLSDLTSQTPDALMRKARQLLCVEVRDVQLCSSDPRAAILVLDEVKQHPESRDRVDVLTLVGRANFQSQRYPDAGEAYDKALQRAGSSNIQTTLALLTSAGDAWYEGKEFGKAAQRYEEWLRLGTESGSMSVMMREQVEVPVKLVRSLGLAGQPREAFDALMQCLKVVHTWPANDAAATTLYMNLKQELGGVIDGLPADDLKSVGEKLQVELSYDPSLEATGLVQVGQAQGRVNRYDDAIENYRKALTLRPNDAGTYFHLGYALAHQSQHPAAIEAYRKSIELRPNDAVTHNNLGVSLGLDRQFDKAIEEYRKSLELNPSYSRARYNLASLLWSRNQFEEAEKVYKAQIQAQPDDTLAYYDLWFLYHHLTKEREAEGVLGSLQKVAAPGDRYLLSILATSREDQGDFARAAEIYAKLHQQHPEVTEYLLNLASMEIRGGMATHDHNLIQAGIDQLEEERRKNPSYVTCLQLGWAYHIAPEVRNLDKAEELYRCALTYKPGDARTLANLTALTLEKGDFQGVISESRKALQVNPGDLDALTDLGYGQFLLGDLLGAIATYDQVLEKTPDAPDVRICRGEALFWLGNSAGAHEEFARARGILSHAEQGGSTWTWFLDSRYDPSEKPRVVYYGTPAEKKALVEFFDGLVYLREMKIPPAKQKYETATHYLANTPDDMEVVRKAINDLHRLAKVSLAEPTAEFGLGYLYDWLGEKNHAAQYWQLYVKSGTDPVGVTEARRHLAQN